MIREALEFLSRQAVASAVPNAMAIEDPRAVHALVGTAHVEIKKPKPPRDHLAECLGDLVSLANRFGACCVVWYCESAVVLVFDDDGHRCEKTTLTLQFSDSFGAVNQLKS